MSKAFGKHLKELRTTKTNYTQEQMAQLLNIDLEIYKQYEFGDLEPSTYRLHLLCDILNVDLIKLLEYEEDNNITSAQIT